MNGFEINFNAATSAGHVTRTDASFSNSKVGKATTDVFAGKIQNANTDDWGIVGLNIPSVPKPSGDVGTDTNLMMEFLMRSNY